MPESNLYDDYHDFVAHENMLPSKHTRSAILDYVKADLHPSPIVIFGKLLVMQVVMGLLTLLFCPQFGFSPTNGIEVFHYIHHNYGESVCMIICGAIFMTPGAIFASYVLKTGEAKKIKAAGSLYHLAIAAVAVFILGANIFSQPTLFWLIGASMAAMTMFDLNLALRPHILRN